MSRKNVFAFNNPRRLLTRAEVDVNVWEERDRLHIRISDKKRGQRTIAEWWDDDARQMFGDGFFKRGVELKRSVIGYAEEMGLIAKPNGARRNIFAFNNEGSPEPNADFAWPNGKARKNVFAFNNAPSGPADADAARELAIFIENDADLYRQQFIPIVKNLMLKRRKGVYDREKAVTLFMYLMESGAKKYIKEYVVSSERPHDIPRIDTMFNRATREVAARMFRDSFEAEAELGNYDRLIGPVSNPLTRREADRALTMALGSMVSAGQQRSGRLAAHYKGRAYGYADGVAEFGPLDMRQGATIKRAEAAVFRNAPGEGRRGLDEFAKSLGLHIETWAPGDGMTRYRFFTKPTDYHGGDGIYTARGLKEAWCFVRGYAASKTGARGNPASADAQSFISGKIGMLVREGYPQQQAIAIAYSMARKAGYRVPARENCCSNPSTCDNPYASGRERRSYQDLLARAKAQHGSKFDDSELDPRFIPYYENGKRIWVDDFGHVASGTVSVTTGWRPVFLLMSSVRAMGSSTLLTKKTKILGEVGIYKPKRGEYGQPIPNGSVRAYKVPGGLEGKVASLLRNAFVWAQARDGEVLTIAKPAIVKRAISHIQKGGGGWTRGNPLTRGESGQLATDAANDAYRARSFRGERRGFYTGRAAMAEDVIRKYGPESVRPNPLLQTVLLANPPIDRKWPSLTRRQRHAALEFAGFPDDYAWALAAAPSWAGLTDSARGALMRSWQENHSRSNPRRAGKPVRVTETVTKQTKRVVGNPGSVRIPFREGQKIPIERARAWVRKLGNPELLRQFEEAERLQTKANKKPHFVIWKTLPIGSAKKIEMLTSFAHYGDSPETMYKPPKGSRKGRHMYRHEWGDGSGRPRPVPVLAASGGKVIVKVMGPGQKTGDWMRG